MSITTPLNLDISSLLRSATDMLTSANANTNANTNTNTNNVSELKENDSNTTTINNNEDKKNHKWTLEENMLLINYLKPLWRDNDKTGDAEIFRTLIKRAQNDGHLLNYNAEANYQSVNKHFKSLQKEYSIAKSFIEPALKQYIEQFPRQPQNLNTPIDSSIILDSINSYDVMYRTFRDNTISKFYKKNRELYDAMSDLLLNKPSNSLSNIVLPMEANSILLNAIHLPNINFDDNPRSAKKFKKNPETSPLTDIKEMLAQIISTQQNLVSKLNTMTPRLSDTGPYPNFCSNLNDWIKVVFMDKNEADTITKLFKQHEISNISINNGDLLNYPLEPLGLPATSSLLLKLKTALGSIRSLPKNH